MGIKVEIKGLDKAIATLNRMNLVAEQRVREQVAESALNVQRGAKERCPVRTGALWNSITVDFYQDGLTAEIAPHMPYAPYVEFGTTRMPAKPYLFPAWEEERPKFEAGIKRAVGEAVEG